MLLNRPYADDHKIVLLISACALLVQIYFATVQVPGAYARLLKDILTNPFRAFLQKLSVAIDIPAIVGGLGLWCANQELSSFKRQIMIATLTPSAMAL